MFNCLMMWKVLYIFWYYKCCYIFKNKIQMLLKYLKIKDGDFITEQENPTHCSQIQCRYCKGKLHSRTNLNKFKSYRWFNYPKWRLKNKMNTKRHRQLSEFPVLPVRSQWSNCPILLSGDRWHVKSVTANPDIRLMNYSWIRGVLYCAVQCTFSGWKIIFFLILVSLCRHISVIAILCRTVFSS